jgi:hypothetical protein
MLNTIKSFKWVKALAMTALVATSAGVLSGCYIEDGGRRYHHGYGRHVIVVR